ncbi:7636_t:CDS:2 [Funneliformis geosporum]|uniref:ATP-dependent DNA helicase n=1 Tax=Funneliformis geosporum TaxID=1117311 RepID=A0A9W4TBA1_9GLOM|nr:7636_t:CDS:2 [Funneliformis geosporum]
MGPNDRVKWPYFFITDSGETRKSFIINTIINIIKRYPLLAPTEVAVQNIGGQTIHLALRITSTGRTFRTCAYANTELNNQLKNIDTLVIDEAFIISIDLFDFISNTFANVHNNFIPFSITWPLFYPLFLRNPQRQQNDPVFYEILQNIRIDRCHTEFFTRSSIQNQLNTTYIVSFREMAQQINTMICNTLPVPDGRFIMSKAIDVVDSVRWKSSFSDHIFKSKMNLPSCIHLQSDA